MRLTRLIGATLMLLTAPAAVAAPARPTGGCRVDHAQYADLKPGMTYRQVRKLLQCGGRRISHLAIGRVRRSTYSWPGRGTYGANITLTFRDNRLTDKAQLGLRAK